MGGELAPKVEAKIYTYDSALMFGDIVFEMTCSFNKKQLRLWKHIESLFAEDNEQRLMIDVTQLARYLSRDRRLAQRVECHHR